MKKHWLLISLLLILASCKQDKDTTSDVSEDDSGYTQPPTQGYVLTPRLFSNGESLYLSWIEKRDSLAILNYAVWQDSWSEPISITSGKDWFVNWADFPAISENNGSILTNILQKSSDSTYTYDIKLNMLSAGSNEWKKDFILHDDGTQSEHGFVSIEPYVENSFFITWLDGRETAGGHHGEGAMTLRAAIVFQDGSIDYDTLLDERICDCCNTAATIGPNAELIVAYRDRTEEEIRDISVKRWTMEEGWLPEQTVGNDGWKIAGCPVNGPAIDAYGTHVALAWFTAADEEGKVKLSFSDDIGANFQEEIRVDNGNATGRVALQMISENAAAVVWMEPDGDKEVIRLQKIHSDGTKGQLITVAVTTMERASGFPQLAVLGDNLFLAWTVFEEGSSRIETEMISMDLL